MDKASSDFIEALKAAGVDFSVDEAGEFTFNSPYDYKLAMKISKECGNNGENYEKKYR